MKQQICNCHKFHTGPCKDSKNIKGLDSFFEIREKYLKAELINKPTPLTCKILGHQYKKPFYNIGTGVYKEFDRLDCERCGALKPAKKPSILRQIKDFIGQIGCDLS